MKIEVIRAHEVDAESKNVWRQFQRDNPIARSPFLGPDFACAVAAVRGDVRIAVLEEDNRLVGFFPFQQNKSSAGQPVGGPLSNAHGVVLKAGVAIDGRDLVRACHLRSWKFHMAMAAHPTYVGDHDVVQENMYIDLSQGFAAYEQGRLAAGSKSYRSLLRKERKLEREAESVKFTFHTDEVAMFDQLIRWKREQLHQKRDVDTFSVEWTTNLLRQILANPSEHLRAVVSVLDVNDQTAAISYDLVGHDIADTWIPAFGDQFASYSPGLILLRRRCQLYAEQDISKVYLGTPGLRWKDTFRSNADLVASGTIDTNRLSRVVKRGVNRSIAWARNSPLRSPGRAAKRALRRVLEHYTLR